MVQSVNPQVAPAGPQSQGFLDRIRNDPIMMQSLLRFGAGLMQPIQPNQSAFGVAGNALADSLDFFNQRKAFEAQSVREDRELGLAEERVGIEQQRADTAQTAAEGQLAQSQAELAENQRQFKEEEGLREARELVLQAEARWRDRLPASTQGRAKVTQTNAVATALIAAEKRAVENGALPADQARYSSNPDLAFLDATNIVEGREGANELLLKVVPSMMQAFEFMTPEEQQNLLDTMQQFVGQVKSEDPTARISGTPADVSPAGQADTAGQGTATGRTASNEQGEILIEYRLPNGTTEWRSE